MPAWESKIEQGANHGNKCWGKQVSFYGQNIQVSSDF